MNILIWMLSGAVVGRLGYSLAGLNDARAKRVSIVIGALGGVVGGHLAAPIFTAALQPLGSVIAAGTTGILYSSSLYSRR